VNFRKSEWSAEVVKSKQNGLFVFSIGSLMFFIVLICLLILADIFYLLHWGVGIEEFWEILTSPQVLDCLRRSFVTSFIALLLIVLTAVPVGYALSRYRFIGHSIINTFVDMPIVLPPVVLGISLLAFFGSPMGNWIKEALKHYNISLVSSVGIVMCQYIVSVSYCIRAVKASFDNVDRQLEHAALTLGCSQPQTFWYVTLPLARNGLIAGCIMAWARAIGVFGPLMVFVGTGSRVQVMPTKMWLELNVGNIENALVVALITMAIASVALAIAHFLAPGRKWS